MVPRHYRGAARNIDALHMCWKVVWNDRQQSRCCVRHLSSSQIGADWLESPAAAQACSLMSRLQHTFHERGRWGQGKGWCRWGLKRRVKLTGESGSTEDDPAKRSQGGASAKFVEPGITEAVALHVWIWSALAECEPFLSVRSVIRSGTTTSSMWSFPGWHCTWMVWPTNPTW